jgi:hypothetical protein
LTPKSGYSGELLQLFRHSFGGVVGDNAVADIVKSPRRQKPTRAAQLILAGQVNHVVGEVELHFVKRKVREGDLLRVDRVPIAVIAEHGRATV